MSTTRHHLDVLVRRGSVFRDASNGRLRFYPTGLGSESERNHLYMSHWRYRDLRLRVLLAVGRTKDARPSTVARSLRISRQLAAYHLARLEELGLVRRENGRYVQRT